MLARVVVSGGVRDMVDKETSIEKEGKCIHHWQLTTDEGAIRGRCLKCGELKVFPDFFKLSMKERTELSKKAYREIKEARARI